MIAKLHRLDIDIGMNSNGALITREDAKILVENGLNHTLISVLGVESIHNSVAGLGGNFKKTIEGIENLLNVGISVAVNMPISKMNLQSLFETAEFVKSIGINNFCSEPVIPSCKSNIPLCLSAEECKTCLRELIRVSSELSLSVDVLEPLARCMFGPTEEKEFVRFFGNRICSAAVSSCAISSKGEMRPCIQSDVSYGNVLPDRFLDVWGKMTDWSSPEILPKECITCNSLMLCEGGCRMSAKITTGLYTGKDMYMTEPIVDPERALLLPTQDHQHELSANDLFEFNKRCIIRKEQNGYVVYLNSRLEYLTSQGFAFLSLLKHNGNFSIASLAKETGIRRSTTTRYTKIYSLRNVVKGGGKK